MELVFAKSDNDGGDGGGNESDNENDYDYDVAADDENNDVLKTDWDTLTHTQKDVDVQSCM